ncbi:hypothetical protein ACIRD6_13970 [Streptomyces sp. NPDC102473]|uniref:hypothetical protein n=1 Tax=Streptomyces sp. NPDC102473 TaxID=3366180 RepID=UPI00381AE2C0
MISEPEMVGGAGAGELRDVVDDGARVPGERRPRSPWWWALGGMAAASVLWVTAGVLHGVGDGGGRPDTHGYRLDAGLCPALRLSSIGEAVAPREPTSPSSSELLQHPALDEIRCAVPLGRSAESGGRTIEYAVMVQVELHKETDPRAEFEARQQFTGRGFEPGAEVESVPDLGDAAYLVTSHEGNPLQQLRVRKGGAVVSLELQVFSVADEATAGEDQETGLPDLTPYRAAMISDMVELWDTLEGE